MEEIKKINLEEKPKLRLSFKKLNLPRLSFSFKRKKYLLVILSVVLFLVLFLVIPSFFVFTRAKAVYDHAFLLKGALKTKNLDEVREETVATRQSLSSLEKSLRPISWVGVIPFIGNYQKDAVCLVRAGEASLEAVEIMVEAVEPYADIVGFSSASGEGGEKTTQDRVEFVVSTLEKVIPEIERVGEKFAIAKKEIDQINPNRYPESFTGKKVKRYLVEIITLVDQVATLTSDAKPVLVKVPWLLGTDEKRNYLVIFQNDGELRPTGGFMTAVALLEVNKGKVQPLFSQDIYTLDARYKPSQKAPEALLSYVTFPYSKDPRWRLRDMNISPDFKTSMDIFVEEFRKVSDVEFDGVVAIDTKVLVRLLEILGPVGVSGWGTFSAEPDKRCDGCPQVVYELERLITKPVGEIRLDRKAVLGPLMHSILANVFGSPSSRVPGLFNAVFTSLIEKDVLFYFPDEEVQHAMESFNLAGRIKDFEGDFFHLNDANLGGAKANMFINQKVSQEIKIKKDGSITKEVVVEYKNPSPHSVGCDPESGGLCLNAPYRNWFRLYVPKGSQLIESLGSEVEIKTYEELGKTVFEGYYGREAPLNPNGGYIRLVFKYKLPFKVSKGEEYKLLIQKQPGKRNPEYEVLLNGQSRNFKLETDKELKFKI